MNAKSVRLHLNHQMDLSQRLHSSRKPIIGRHAPNVGVALERRLIDTKAVWETMQPFIFYIKK